MGITDPALKVTEAGILLIIIGITVAFATILFVSGYMPTTRFALFNSSFIYILGVYTLFAALFTFIYPRWLRIAHPHRVIAGGLVLLMLAFLF